MEFCKRHVFEIPFSTYCNGHQLESLNKKHRLHIKVTDHFKAAFLLKDTTETLSSTCDESKNVCSNKLGISLEDAKNIQRKIANILDLNPASLFLDTISEGSVILTFLLPTCVSTTSRLRPQSLSCTFVILWNYHSFTVDHLINLNDRNCYQMA